MSSLKNLIKESINVEKSEILDWMTTFAFDFDLNELQDFIDEVILEFDVHGSEDELIKFIEKKAKELLTLNSRYEDHSASSQNQLSSGFDHHYIV